jgi:hypothetical protein
MTGRMCDWIWRRCLPSLIHKPIRDSDGQEHGMLLLQDNVVGMSGLKYTDVWGLYTKIMPLRPTAVVSFEVVHVD